MSVGTVRTVSREELQSRRLEILSKLGLTLDQVRDDVTASTRSSDEWDAFEELHQIAFLLGEELS